ncbi:unnamed protein product [Miscanthus lutarioriparius]|uniref:ABC transporter domain-containing protein n=1 Tax=Miscanthus lutarioriparius TaxID=422564 RepID=A0A811S5V1_9POAL|nr:unnamed protein product [Miscanthus lutarioriparius]
MEMSDKERMEMSTVECKHLSPSWQGNGDADAEVEVEEDHLWPTKDGPLPIFLKRDNAVRECGVLGEDDFEEPPHSCKSGVCIPDDGGSGSVDPGEILALMGPSGSGKTTLLKILGGRLGGGIKGQITYNNTPYSACLKRRIGFVTQDDVLFPQLTVEETLVFAAFLRLPACMSKQQKRDRVPAHQDRRSVREGLRGVSGGERKRTSIGNEILVYPSLLLLDEPTSGLDSTSASKLILILQRLAKKRRTIMTTIHQPSSRMFHMYDKLLLISDGRGIYHGKARDCMHHFSSLGFVPEIPMNPAEFLLDLATGNLDDISVPEALLGGSPDPQEFRPQVIRHLQLKYRAGGEPPAGGRGAHRPAAAGAAAVRRAVSAHVPGARLRLPGQDAARPDPRRGAPAGPPLVEVPDRDRGPAAGPGGAHLLRLHLLDVVVGSSLFGSVYVFPVEKLYLVKERKADMYLLSAYYASSTLCDAVPHVVYPVLFMAILYFMAGLRRTVPCFFLTLLATLLIVFTSQGTGELLGAAILSIKRAGVMASLVLMLFLLTGGYYVQHIPKFIRWLKYVSFMHYGFNLLLKAQYHGHLTYNCASRGGCQRLQSSPSFGTVDLDGGMREVWILLAMALAYRILAYFFLLKRISLTPL